MTAAAWETAMSVVKPEHLLAELLDGPEYQADPLVRHFLQLWRRGDLPAAECLLGLVRAQAADRRRLVDQAVDLVLRQPFHHLAAAGDNGANYASAVAAERAFKGTAP